MSKKTLTPAPVSTLARSYKRGVQLDIHVHREAQLLFSAHGVMQVTTPRGQWLVPPSRAVWIPPRVEHAVSVLADIEMRALLFDPAWLKKHPEVPRLDRTFVVRVEPLLRETVLALFAHPASAQNRALGEVALFTLPEAQDAATFIPMPADARARRVADMVLADPAGRQEIEALAKTAGASARTISRLFRAETTFAFKEWRQRARIVAAVNALSGADISVKRLAHRLGFSSTAAFSHAFGQVMGMTPTAFLAQSQKALRKS